MSLPPYNDQPFPTPLNEQDIANSRRGTRACDRCRKVKSRCEPGPQGVCKNCYATGSSCTYEGPSFKRGPPKGYIQAIERRWHQVESLLGVIMASPQAKDTIAILRRDSLAREILDRVNSGPYGPTGRLAQSGNSQTENFYAAVMDTEQPTPFEDRRSRRQSRISREIVSVEDGSVMPTPTREWQEQLLAKLKGNLNVSGYSTPSNIMSSPNMSTPGAGPSSMLSTSGETGRTRRRLDTYYTPEEAPPLPESNQQVLYTISDEKDELDDTVTSFGRLSVDENKEIRYHGNASGLHLLAKGERTDDSEQRQNGIWRFSRPRPDLSYEDDRDAKSHEDGVRFILPPIEVQLHLIDLYFTYIHPVFPVLYKQDFMSNFGPFYSHSTRSGEGRASPIQNPLQQISNLLLFAIFSIAARYSTTLSKAAGQEDPSVQYAIVAREILNQIYQFSRPSTCQALLLLGVREFGIGDMEHGWLFTGMAMRMAVDLGMNHDADKWVDESGKYLFTPSEKQIRKHIWWACCIADKLSSVWLGRPITLRRSDHSTLKPDIIEAEEYELWQPCPPDALGPNFSPSASRVPSCYRAACDLSTIMSEIMEKVYPVQMESGTPRQEVVDRLETKVNDWLINLPDHLKYDLNVPRGKNVPLPHILTLHIEYYASVLLLYRAFIPKWNNINEHVTSDPFPIKAFNLCQSAATRITSIVTVYSEKYRMERAPPFLSIYLQSAGIMHVVTLLRHPHHSLATVGLKQCIDALRLMEITWPSALSVRKLLEGAKVQLFHLSNTAQHVDRLKRSAETAGMEKSADLLRPEFRAPPVSMPPVSPMVTANNQFGFDEVNLSTMAPAFGGIPALDTATSMAYYPGGGHQQWWPRAPANGGGIAAQQRTAFNHHQLYGMRGEPAPAPRDPMQPGMPTKDEFTFEADQLSPEFVRGVHYPVLDFSQLFPEPNVPHYNSSNARST